MKANQCSKILLVDDEEKILNALKRALKNENYEIFTAFDATEALNIMKRDKIDLVLADYLMPQMTGNELLNRIRVLHPDTLRLSLTGNANLHNAMEAINEGEIYRYMTKPWHDEDLKQVIRQALELKHAKEGQFEAKNRLYSFLDSATEGFAILDSELNIVEINEAAARILKQKKENISGLNVVDVWPDIKESGVFDKFMAAINNGKYGLYADFPAIHTFENKHLMIKSFKITDGLGVMLSDVTKNELAQEAIRRSETLYRTLYDSSRDAVILLDQDSFFDCNNATLKLFDCNTKEEFYAKHPGGMSPPNQPCGTDSFTLANERIKTAIKRGANRFEWVYAKKNGHEFPVDVMLSAMELDGRKVCQAVVRDITEYKKIENAIIRAKQEWERTFDIIPDLIMILDNKNRITRLNKAMADKLGVAPAEAIGLTCYKHMHGTDEPPPFCPHIKLMKDGKRHIEEIYEERLKGHFVISVSPIYDEKGQLAGSVHVANDITKRKQMEEALRKSEGVLKKAQQLAKLVSWEWDLNDNIFYPSEEMRLLGGIPGNEKIGSIQSLANKYIHPDDKNIAITKLSEIQTKGSTEPITFRIVRSDGNVQWVVFSVAEQPMYLKHDKMPRTITGTAQDITEHMNTQKEKRKLEIQLLQSEKMASLGQLAAGVAHEINNPVGFVSSNLTTLLDYQKDIKCLTEEYRKLSSAIKDIDTKADLPSSITELLAHIKNIEKEVDIDYIMGDVMDLIEESKDGTDRIKKIVLDMKDFAHPGEDEKKNLDINKGIESTLNVVRNEIKYKAEVTKDYGEIPLVEGYPQQLNQVFMNILVNAAQAIEERGEIKIDTQAVDGFVVITISDTGAGIHEENLSKIFDPFFTTKEVGKGTGLGMNVAYGIIKKHNGIIEVDSTVGKGTTFRIRIPIN